MKRRYHAVPNCPPTCNRHCNGLRGSINRSRDPDGLAGITARTTHTRRMMTPTEINRPKSPMIHIPAKPSPTPNPIMIAHILLFRPFCSCLGHPHLISFESQNGHEKGCPTGTSVPTSEHPTFPPMCRATFSEVTTFPQSCKHSMTMIYAVWSSVFLINLSWNRHGWVDRRGLSDVARYPRGRTSPAAQTSSHKADARGLSYVPREISPR